MMSRAFVMRYFPLSVGLASTLAVLVALVGALLGGSWRVTLDFNAYGEGFAELVLLVVAVPLQLAALREIARIEAALRREAAEEQLGGTD